MVLLACGIWSHELDAGMVRPRDEVHVAREAIEFRDRQRRFAFSAQREGSAELRALVERNGALARLHFRELGEQRRAAPGEVVGDGLLLRLEAETRASLLLRAHPVVRDELAFGQGLLTLICCCVYTLYARLGRIQAPPIGCRA